MGGLLTGSPQRTNGRAQKPRFCLVGLTIFADHLDGLDLSEPSFRDNDIRALPPKQIASVIEVKVLCLVGQSVEPRRQASVTDTADRAVTELCPHPILLTY